MAFLLDADVVASCDAIRTLAVHEAWFCANTVSLCFEDAKRDREKADIAFKCLRDLLPFELANLLRKMAKHSSWYAANTRRFLFIDAWRNEKIWKDCCAALRLKLDPDLAEALELTFQHEAWRAANVRSFLWSDAVLDEERSQEAWLRLQPLMRTVQMDEREKQREAERLKESQTEKLRGNQDYEQLLSTRRGPSCFAFGIQLGMLVGWWAKQEEEVPLSPLRLTPLMDSDTESVNLSPRDSASSQCTPVSSPRTPPCECCSMIILAKTEAAWRAVAGDQEGIPVTSFLAAASATVAIIDCFGSLVSKVKDDIQGNVEKIQKNVDVAESSCTLEQMVDAELAAATSPAEAAKEGSTALALLWLGRMLRLVARTMVEIDENSTKSVSQCLQAGYDSCLSQHHPWAVRVAMGVVIRGCPSRQAFLEKLGGDPADAMAEAARLHKAMSPVLAQIQSVMISRGLEEKDL